MNELTLTLLTSVRCSWCGNLVSPSDTEQIEVRDDKQSEHATGAVPVCTECLEAVKEL